ncbi:hypothetical protein [Nitrosopumilus sp. Nsub]|uniref:hypothetical protein n=1 Tax=Nitrosopumilus sp. Nsub TaxID=1776294 RepID=UPI000837479E|nr:hypothetical protein [Nitrosopumilus sp. Nsub]
MFWFEIGFGLFVLLILISLGIITLKEKTRISDDKIIQIVNKKMLYEGHCNFELTSIVTIDKITTVFVHVGYQEIALEIDNESGLIRNVERIAR